MDKTFEFTFQDSGQTVTLRKLSFLTTSAVHTDYKLRHPAPAPPLQKHGEGEESFEEANPNDPKYQLAYAEWVTRVNHANELYSRYMYAKRALASVIDESAVKQVLDDAHEMGTDLAATIQAEFREYEVPFDANYLNAYLFLWYVSAVTASDYKDLVKVVTQRTQPVPSAVDASVASFRDKA